MTVTRAKFLYKVSKPATKVIRVFTTGSEKKFIFTATSRRCRLGVVCNTVYIDRLTGDVLDANGARVISFAET